VGDFILERFYLDVPALPDKLLIPEKAVIYGIFGTIGFEEFEKAFFLCSGRLAVINSSEERVMKGKQVSSKINLCVHIRDELIDFFAGFGAETLFRLNGLRGSVVSLLHIHQPWCVKFESGVIVGVDGSWADEIFDVFADNEPIERFWVRQGKVFGPLKRVKVRSGCRERWTRFALKANQQIIAPFP
jgi:hypothetical protein